MSDDLKGAFESAAVELDEGGRAYHVLSIEDIHEIARSSGISPGEASARALEAGFLPLRYRKNVGTTGLDGQAKLLRSRVVVVGAGGIGGNACELLARMGIGSLLLVDPDVFEESNLNRQNFSAEDTLGLPKVEVVRDRLSTINCDVNIEVHRLAAGPENLGGLLAGADAAIDGLDNFYDRVQLQAACREAGVVMVHGAIAGSSLQLMTIFPGDAGLESLVDPGTREEKARGIEVETGNPATTPALVAALQVSEALKVILGLGEPIRGRMFYMDLSDLSAEFFEV
ncbi:MAG: HesA/MoeB/ThiF family protein [Actinobacteria bacterium]|nr:HesA/MoeB/ThiF family protein [Actinomycetota bacterium]MBU1944514.1 HesA/MoeB/ThiF family protein [Actinomycetota bacterium]MBU2689067.1 HesA/MoeB/ThiF family protein [Actinomycetota bacterium]